MAHDVYGAPQFAASQNALSVTAEVILTARPQRISAIVRNIDNSITVYLGAEGVDSTGFPLPAGASVTLTTTASVYAVAASGTPTVAIWEEYS